MTTPEERAALRERHHKWQAAGGPICESDEENWPCDAIALLDEVAEQAKEIERLRAILNDAVCLFDTSSESLPVGTMMRGLIVNRLALSGAGTAGEAHDATV